MLSLKDVTIIIPVYCTTQESLTWLDECIASAVEQRCHISICDDGSPIDTMPTIQKHHAANVSVLKSRERRGVSAARNTAVGVVQTPLIYPLDCDDVLQPNTIKTLLKYWDGVPIYHDLEMFGSRAIQHYNLKDFTCNDLITAVSIASVNVLHAVEQWKSIGGWDENVLLYEDGEYNSRLFGEYCGFRVPLPLLRYRQHDHQRSRGDHNGQAARMLSVVKENVMARKCCGQGKNTVAQTQSKQQAPAAKSNFFHLQQHDLSQSASLPGSTEGTVRARYIGGRGKAEHYYRGRVTKHPYKVVYGAEIKADVRDTVASEADAHIGLLVALEQPKKPEVEKVAPPKFFRPTAEEEPVKTAVEQILEEAADDGDLDVSDIIGDVNDDFVKVEDPELGETFDVPNIRHMSLEALRGLEDLTPWDAQQMLVMESGPNGKNRKKHIAFLNKIIKNDG